MNVLEVFKKKSIFFYVFLVVVSLINSLFYSGLLIFINNVISGEKSRFFNNPDWVLFSIFLVSSFLISKFFQTYIIRLSFDMMSDYELLLIDKVRKAPLESFEKLGEEKIYSAIGDTRILARLPEVFINSLNSIAIIVCCFIYLFYISYVIGTVILFSMFFLLFIYLVSNKNIEAKLNKVRDLQNDYYRYLKDLLFGFKEIKMSNKRNDTLYDDFIKVNRIRGNKIGVETSVKYLNNELLGSYSWYIILGVIIFLLPKISGITLKETTIYIITILYMIGPIANLIVLLPFYTSVKITLQRVNEIFLSFSDMELKTTESSDHTALEPFQSLKLTNVSYEYMDRTNGRHFVLGPLNLTLNKGEIIFITGGNGSGKSTFVNLITGLYKPSSGKMLYNNSEIGADNTEKLSDKISVIFCNNYLFGENYNGFDFENDNFDQYLEELQLEKIVKIGEDKILDMRLSKGQQKRVAMAYALMENKELIILDEWAAEQDPEYRKYFYEILLPKLKDKGKTIIAITHDDRYFSSGDRVVKFEYGKIVLDKTTMANVI